MNIKQVIFALLTISLTGNSGAIVGPTAIDSVAMSQDLEDLKTPPGTIFQWPTKAPNQTLLDAFIKAGMSKKILTYVFQYFDQNSQNFPNTNFMTLVDFSKRLSEERFYLLDLRTGDVTKLHVGHGIGSDPSLSGLATVFSDTPNSLMSSLGFYKTLDDYGGDFGYSLRLDGLSPENHNAYDRSIVLHGNPIGPGYSQAACRQEQVDAGREEMKVNCLAEGALTSGCLGVTKSAVSQVIAKIKNGSLIFAYNGINWPAL